MKKWIMLVVLLTAGAVFAQQTQDLGAASKKEKERREALAKEGKKAKVYTAEDLERVKDKLGIESTPGEPSGEETVGTEGEVAEPASPAEPEPASPMAEIDSQKQGIETQLQQLKQQRDELVSTSEAARDTLNQGGGGAMTVNPAVEHQKVRESQAKIEELDAKIRELEGKVQDLDKKAEEVRKEEERKAEEAQEQKEE